MRKKKNKEKIEKEEGVREKTRRRKEKGVERSKQRGMYKGGKGGHGKEANPIPGQASCLPFLTCFSF